MPALSGASRCAGWFFLLWLVRAFLYLAREPASGMVPELSSILSFFLFEKASRFRNGVLYQSVQVRFDV